MPNRSDVSEVVFDTDLISIGRFRCPSHHRAWTEENWIGDFPLIVFPRLPVLIKQSGRHEVLADPNCVMYYNSQHLYRRGLMHERGDQCEYFRVNSNALAEIVSAFDPSAKDHPDSPFTFCNGPSSAEVYMIQRRVFDYVSSMENPSILHVQETMLRVIRRIVSAAFQVRGKRETRSRRSETVRAHRETVEAAKVYLASHMREAVHLNDVAQAVHVSPYHLCRVFRRETGLSLHQYQSQLRLRSSLEQIGDPRIDLTALALSFGYSSHSHFTSAFTRAFKRPPSQFSAS